MKAKKIVSRRMTGCFILFFLFFFALSSAQLLEKNAEHPLSGNETVQFEPLIFSLDSGLVRIDILYRIRYDFFVFVRDDYSGGETYAAKGELSIEILDSSGTSICRKIVSLRLNAKDNSTQFLKSVLSEGIVSLTMKPGTYLPVYRLEDHQSNRFFSDSKQSFTAVEPVSPFASSLFFIEKQDSTARIGGIRPVNRGGNLAFGKDASALFLLRSASVPADARVTLRRLDLESKEERVVFEDSSFQLSGSSRMTIAAADSGINYKPIADPQFFFVTLPLPVQRWKQGRYTISIRLPGKDTSRISATFSLRWESMPQSLRDLDFALESMKHYATEEEYADITSGNRESKIEKFNSFWEKRDPTPATAYNEFMAEYFRRVDYSFVQFRTLKDDNGAMTDRGKIYILFGPPSAVDRSLNPNNPPREIWKYYSRQKTFIFEDPTRQGNYQLITSEQK